MSSAKSGAGGAQDRAEIAAVQDRIARRIKELRAFDVSGITDRWDSRLENAQKNVNKLIGEAFGTGSPLYKQHAIGPLDAALDVTFGDRYTQQEFHDEIRKAPGQAATKLAKKLVAGDGVGRHVLPDQEGRGLEQGAPGQLPLPGRGRPSAPSPCG